MSLRAHSRALVVAAVLFVGLILAGAAYSGSTAPEVTGARVVVRASHPADFGVSRMLAISFQPNSLVMSHDHTSFGPPDGSQARGCAAPARPAHPNQAHARDAHGLRHDLPREHILEIVRSQQRTAKPPPGPWYRHGRDTSSVQGLPFANREGVANDKHAT